MYNFKKDSTSKPEAGEVKLSNEATEALLTLYIMYIKVIHSTYNF